MAWSLVATGTLQTGTTSVTGAYGATPTAGNLLICAVASDGTIGWPGGSWVDWDGSFTNTPISALFWRVAAGGDAAPTSSGTGSTTMQMVCAEFSGNAASPLDQAVVQLASGAGNVSGSATLADSATGELFVAALATSLSKAGTDTTTISMNNNGTPAYTDVFNNDASSLVVHLRLGYFITTSNAAGNGVNMQDTSMNLVSLRGEAASFKVGAAAAPSVIPYVGGGYYGYMKALREATRRLWRGWRPERGLWVPA